MGWPRAEADVWDELIVALRVERQRQGLTILELEERAGFCRNHLEKLENGVRRPTGFVLAVWAWSLGLRLQLAPLNDIARAPEDRPPDRIRRRLPRACPLTL
ncbi:MAG TPA: helix-turn-helix transcriptional regulator [Dongiaceae bacterium]